MLMPPRAHGTDAERSSRVRLDRSSRGVARGHVHWFRWAGDDPFSSATFYRCRCGTVRSGP